jgi:hypothetical protein
MVLLFAAVAATVKTEATKTKWARLATYCLAAPVIQPLEVRVKYYLSTKRIRMTKYCRVPNLQPLKVGSQHYLSPKRVRLQSLC